MADSSVSGQSDDESVALAPNPASIVQYEHANEVAKPLRGDSKLSKVLGLFELQSPPLYRATLIEFIGTLAFTFMSCSSVVSTLGQQFAQPPLLIAIFHFFLLAIFIFATAVPSGGHLNPLITLSTVFAGLSSPVRGALYIAAQSAGAILGALLLKAGLDSSDPGALGACLIPPDMSLARALVFEVFFSLALVFVAFGTALDAHQREIFGPVLAPFFISATVAMVIYSSGGLVPGYTGAGANPSRCLGPAVATGNYRGQAVYWGGPALAAVAIAVLYKAVPPAHEKLCEEKRARRRHQRARAAAAQAAVDESERGSVAVWRSRSENGLTNGMSSNVLQSKVVNL